MLILLDFGYISERKTGNPQVGTEGLAVACWSLEPPKKQTLQRCASADRMAEPSVFTHFRTGGFLHEKNHRPGFDADDDSIHNCCRICGKNGG